MSEKEKRAAHGRRFSKEARLADSLFAPPVKGVPHPPAPKVVIIGGRVRGATVLGVPRRCFRHIL